MSKTLPFFRHLSTAIRNPARLALPEVARLNQVISQHGFKPVLAALHQRLKFITDENGVQNPFAFGSDTGSPILPEIVAEIAENSIKQYVHGFNEQDLTEEFDAIKKLFVDEAKFPDVKVFTTSSTSQANKLAVTCVGNINPRNGDVALATIHSHIFIHEVDQPAVKIIPEDATGKMTVEDIMRTKAEYEELGKRVKVIHIDQPTNGDHYYTPDEIRAITSWAHSQNIAVTMDVERLINYLPICNKTYRDFTVDCGVDVVTFGMQKNGGPRSSTVVVLNDQYLSESQFVAQRVESFTKAMGNISNNMGLIMSGWKSFLDGKLHMYNASKANRQINKIAGFVKDFVFTETQKKDDQQKQVIKPLVMQHYPLTSNMLFAKFPRDFIDMFNNFTALHMDGRFKHFKLAPDRFGVTRIVASHDTSDLEVQNMLYCLHNVYSRYAAQKRLPCNIADIDSAAQTDALDFQEKYGLFFNSELEEFANAISFSEVPQMTSQAIKIMLEKMSQNPQANHKFTSAVVPFDPKVLTVFCTKNAGGYHVPYGDDEVTYDAVLKLRELFNAPEAPLSFTSSKAQATNCVTQFLKAANESQILVSQGSYPQHCAHDRKVMPMSLSGENKKTDKLDPKVIDTLLSYHNSARGKHTPFLAGVMINQPTSSGYIYTQQEIKDIVIVAHKHHIPVVMELNGFAYYLAKTGQSYADYTTECGVDVVTLGLQGVGGALSSVCMVLDRQLLNQRSSDANQTQLRLDRTVKANGGRNSDSSSLACGWSEILQDDLWRVNANKTNAQIDKLTYELRGYQFDGKALEFENLYSSNNVIAVKLPPEFIEILNEKGYEFKPNGNNFTRIMVHYHVNDEDTEKLIADFRESYHEYSRKQAAPAPKPSNPKGFPYNLAAVDRGRGD